MPEKNSLAVLTISVMAMLTMLYRPGASASKITAYDDVLSRPGTRASKITDYDDIPSIFRNKENKAENLLKLLLLPVMNANTSPIQQEQTGVINPFLPSDYVNEGTFYPLTDFEGYSIEAPESRDQILSVNEFKSDSIDDYVKPSLINLLKLIDRYKIADSSSVSGNEVKRNWEGNTVFGTLVDAAGRLGRMNGGDSKSESRRFHSWGG